MSATGNIGVGMRRPVFLAKPDGVTPDSPLAVSTTPNPPGTLYNDTGRVITTNGSLPPVATTAVAALAVDFAITAISGVGAGVVFIVERLLADGLTWAQLYASANQTAAGVVSTSIGPGLAVTGALTGSLRVRWTVSGTTPSITATTSVVGR